MSNLLIPISYDKSNFKLIEEHEDLQLHPDFSKNPKLQVYLQAFIKTASRQVERIDDKYYFEYIEEGELLEDIIEHPSSVTTSKMIALIKFIARSSYYVLESSRLKKECGGHLREVVKVNQRFRNKNHVEKIENKILKEWSQRSDIKPASLKIERLEWRSLFYLKRFSNFYMSYQHKDNVYECSYPHVKYTVEENRNFEHVIEDFEATIEKLGLDYETQWQALAKHIFKNQIIFIK